MSADLLRRAAKVLRIRVARLSVDLQAPWRLVVTDAETLSGIAGCRRHELDPAWSCDYCETIDVGRERTAEYLDVMQPAVALALADWLDSAARDTDEFGSDFEPHAFQTARAILREEP